MRRKKTRMKIILFYFNGAKAQHHVEWKLEVGRVTVWWCWWYRLVSVYFSKINRLSIMIFSVLQSIHLTLTAIIWTLIRISLKNMKHQKWTEQKKKHNIKKEIHNHTYIHNVYTQCSIITPNAPIWITQAYFSVWHKVSNI